MPARQLPGFYYDEAKRKYFRIQPNHVAPAGSRYSQQSVQREAKEATPKKPEMKSDRIQRSRIFNHPLGGGFNFKRETSFQQVGQLSDCRSAAWACGLTKTRRMPWAIEKFLYDSVFDVVHCSLSDSPKAYRSAIPSGNGDYDPDVVQYFQSAIVSFDLSPARWLMSTTMGSLDPIGDAGIPAASIELTKLREPDCSSDFTRPSLGNDTIDMLYGDTSSTFRKPAKIFWVSSFPLRGRESSYVLWVLKIQLFRNLRTSFNKSDVTWPLKKARMSRTQLLAHTWCHRSERFTVRSGGSFGELVFLTG